MHTNKHAYIHTYIQEFSYKLILTRLLEFFKMWITKLKHIEVQKLIKETNFTEFIDVEIAKFTYAHVKTIKQIIYLKQQLYNMSNNNNNNNIMKEGV